MLFNSLAFLYAFLPATYLIFWRLRSKSQRYAWLSLTGYVFYGFWNYRFCLLMAFSTLVSYFAGLGLLRYSNPRHRRLCLVLPVTIDLALLGFFKYTNFALDTAQRLSHLLGVSVSLPALNIILPVGISFYTFHTITYIVDCYRGAIRPTRSLLEFSCYVSLFAQLVAGPIVRFRQIEDDLEHIDQDRHQSTDPGRRPEQTSTTIERWAALHRGWSFFAIGLAKKVLLADTIGSVLQGEPPDLSTPATWLCALGYTYQLYFDFSGYSDMAVGLALMFGLRLPQNFDSPYKALDPSDFWRRWHISLSSMLRDYLYVPLGGNRGGRLATYRNLMLTMLLGGLWHGANWTFVAWGGYHGLLLCLYRALARPWNRVPPMLRRIAMFVLVLIGWVIFRAPHVAAAARTLKTMFVYRAGADAPQHITLFITLAAATGIAHFLPNTWQISHTWRPTQTLGLGLIFVLCLVVIYAGQPSPFLYFQF